MEKMGREKTKQQIAQAQFLNKSGLANKDYVSRAYERGYGIPHGQPGVRRLLAYLERLEEKVGEMDQDREKRQERNEDRIWDLMVKEAVMTEEEIPESYFVKELTRLEPRSEQDESDEMRRTKIIKKYKKDN